MKTAFATVLAAALFATLGSAGIVITPVHANQIVPKTSGDCALGDTTPFGCAVRRS